MARSSKKGKGNFGAPLGRSVWIITLLTFVLLSLVSLSAILKMPPSTPWWTRWLGAAICIGIFGGSALFSIRGYSLSRKELRIRRLFWETMIPLKDLQRAWADPAVMNRSFRTMGNGGLFAFSGWFRNKKLGKFRAFVTDPKRSVVLEFRANETIVVSPDDPDEFLKVLGVEFAGNNDS